jgi:dCMP deaminase
MTDGFALSLLTRVEGTSHDPNTPIACLIRLRDGSSYLDSANRIPDGVQSSEQRLERPAKYKFVLHAEARAIAKAAAVGVSLTGATLFINWFPCSQCAGSIIEAGITCVNADRQKFEARKDDPLYGFNEAFTMLSEAGVSIEWH